MRYALLIVGQARFFEQGYDTIKTKIIDEYNPDIYIHTWRYEDNIAQSSPWNNLGNIPISNEDIDRYIALYKPVSFEVEDALKTENIPGLKELYTRTSHPNTRYNFYSYCYSLNKCYELAKNAGVDYDMYIIVRSDVIVNKLPKVDELQPSKITVYHRFPTRTDGVLDTMMCFIPRNYISSYCDMYKRLDEYYDKGYFFNFEELTYAHFKENRYFDDVILLPRDNFHWGYFRRTHIEWM